MPWQARQMLLCGPCMQHAHPPLAPTDACAPFPLCCSPLPLSSPTQQVQSKDKDFRYMATSDLLTELSKDTFHVDAEMEKRLCGVVGVQLEDTSADISALALRW